MEIGRGPEVPIDTATTENGFSEKRAARIIEGKQQDNSQVKKSLPAGRHGKPVSAATQAVLNRAARLQKSTKEKILAAHKKNADALIELIQSLNMLAKDSLAQEEQLMMQIRARHRLQEELLDALALETQGQLKEESLSKEIRDLIK